MATHKPVPSRQTCKKKESQKRTNETVKRHFFSFTEANTLKILDNCQLPRSDCYAIVRKKQTDTLVFVAFGQTRLPRKLDEKFRGAVRTPKQASSRCPTNPNGKSEGTVQPVDTHPTFLGRESLHIFRLDKERKK